MLLRRWQWTCLLVIVVEMVDEVMDVLEEEEVGVVELIVVELEVFEVVIVMVEKVVGEMEEVVLVKLLLWRWKCSWRWLSW